jgi:FlaA1/EpsC-like NDP-sugar epimerase
LSGIPQNEVKIVFTGLRPGEKLFEDLFYEFERRQNTSVEKVLRTSSPAVPWPKLLAGLTALHAESLTGIPARIRARMKEIVPQYMWTAPNDANLQPIGSQADELHTTYSHAFELRANGRTTLAST